MSDLLQQSPSPGKNLIFHEGDFLNIELAIPEGLEGRAYLRTTLFNPEAQREELIDRSEKDVPRRFQEWGDLPMSSSGNNLFHIELPLDAIGFFEAKAYFISESGSEPLWPEGDNLYIKVEPADSVISNSIYCAFVRLFAGEEVITSIKKQLKEIESVGEKQFSIIPESGKFRDLAQKVEFIIEDLGFDIIMLLPVHPVPTTYARMGLFGSPYAALDFMNVDPALAEFDKKTTPLEQFTELVDAVHARHARIFMDIPVNHTGWASQLQIHHPEFFMKSDEGRFISPGAWGVTWSDLSELNYSKKALWKYMADVFLFWCRKGVDGFRCDAGYMVPARAWEYITAKVRREYPSTLFLLEGLGGKVSTTEQLLTRSNLNWAYSEMFQNYDQKQMEWYIEEFKRISRSSGPLINFSETHDNNRLASVSKKFSILRNGLTALLSDTGTFAITCGVEWFATENVDVHRLTSINWGNDNNQVGYLKRLNNILKSHPTFQSRFDLTTMHTSDLNSIAYLRHSDHTHHKLAIIANLAGENNQIVLRKDLFREFAENNQDLLSGEDMHPWETDQAYQLELKPYQVVLLGNDPQYLYQITDRHINKKVTEIKSERLLRIQIMRLFHNRQGQISEAFIERKTKEFEQAPYDFFFNNFPACPPVIRWIYPRDVNRMVIVPANTPVLIMAPLFFRYSIRSDRGILGHGEGFYLQEKNYVSIIPSCDFCNDEVLLNIELYGDGQVIKRGGHMMVSSSEDSFHVRNQFERHEIQNEGSFCALSVNRHSGTSIAAGAFGEINSKYDALISANLNPDVPDDRHIMLTRLRGWSVYKGFSRALISEYQTAFFHHGNVVEYHFNIPAGGGMFIPLNIAYIFDEHDHLLRIKLKRVESDRIPTPPDEEEVRIILRPDIESRNHHELTKAFRGPENEWPQNIQEQTNGFTFRDQEKWFRLIGDKCSFVREDEWHYMVPHPLETERGMDGDGDLFSPGYFEVLLKAKEEAHLTARVSDTSRDDLPEDEDFPVVAVNQDEQPGSLMNMLKQSIRKFIVNRNDNLTVIAGYPWFLDWGRDTLICLRGIISAGFVDEAKSIIREFASFEKDGTLPNVIRGTDTSNRDTSDAPLWLFVAVHDILDREGDRDFLEVDCQGRTLMEVLHSIAENYITGTPNGIQMDKDSSLIYSPTHFTWMDTNYPAGTPREGYPVEIQALWYHAVTFLSNIYHEESKWSQLAGQIKESILRYFLVEKHNDTIEFEKELYLSDCLHTNSFKPASMATPDDHLRPNQLFALTLDAVDDQRISRGILTACEELLVPGAIRTLADRDTEYQLPVYHNEHLLNDPSHPYKGRYVGDEDHTRKPAYHNGTAWTWPFPSYCEALYRTFGNDAIKASRDILFTSMSLMNSGCVAQLPEILDGNYPHHQRGCFAQAWGMTEFYRVARLLNLVGDS